jgi:hypothetical protein
MKPNLLFIFVSVMLLIAAGLIPLHGTAGEKTALRFEYQHDGRTLAHDYVLGTDHCPKPTMEKPAKGVWFFDPCFGTKISRISDRKIDNLKHRSKGGYGSLMHPAYPKHNWDNADGSYLMFYGSYESGKVIYDAKSLKLIKALSTKAVSWNQPAEPRWDAHDPDVLYYHYRPSLALSRYDVRRDTFRVLHDFSEEFPDAKTMTMAEEGNCSYDSRYFAFQLKGPRGGKRWAHLGVFCYDRVEDRVVGNIETPIPGVEKQGAGNWVGMSPSGKFVLIGTAPVLVYDREFKGPPTKLTHGGGWHCDVGLDDEGREVVFYKGGRKYSPAGRSDGCYAMCDLETGEEIVLTKRIGGVKGMHFDCSSVFTPGWGLVSTYHAAPEEQTHWTEYSIHLVELTRRKQPPPRIWRICHTHTNRESYSDDPFATFSRFGTKIFFGSNWGVPIKKGGDIDAYQVELPQDWYEQLMGPEKAKRLRGLAQEIARKKW